MFRARHSVLGTDETRPRVCGCVQALHTQQPALPPPMPADAARVSLEKTAAEVNRTTEVWSQEPMGGLGPANAAGVLRDDGVNARAFAFLRAVPLPEVDCSTHLSQCANLRPLQTDVPFLSGAMAGNTTADRCPLCQGATRRKGAARLRGEPQSVAQEGVVVDMHDSAQAAASLVLRGKKVGCLSRLPVGASAPTKPLGVGPQGYVSRRARGPVTTTSFPFSTFHWALQVMSKVKGDEYDFTTPESWAMLEAPGGTPGAQPVPTSTASPTSVRVHCDDGQVVCSACACC